MVFIIWHNYDGAWCEEFASPLAAQERLNVLQPLQDEEENGTHIDAVIQGRKLKYETIEVAKRVKLEGT